MSDLHTESKRVKKQTQPSQKILEGLSEESYSNTVEICVSKILKERLNIHLPKDILTSVLSYCGTDMKKVNLVVRYANTIGVSGVLQVLKG